MNTLLKIIFLLFTIAILGCSSENINSADYSETLELSKTDHDDGLYTDDGDPVLDDGSDDSRDDSGTTSNSTGGGFTIWSYASGISSCSSTFSVNENTVTYDFRGYPWQTTKKVRQYQNCTTSTAGNIHVSITHLDGIENLSAIGIPGTIEDISRVADPLPSGSYATITAATECEILGWRTAGGSYFTTNASFKHYSDDPAATYVLEVKCGSGSGGLL